MMSNSVGDCIRSLGHDVSHIRDHSVPGTEDRTVVFIADQLSAVVITRNRKHFRPLIHRNDAETLRETPNAGLLTMKVPEADSPKYLEQWMPMIEAAFALRQLHAIDKRFIADLTVTGLTLR